jgi:hypothetical protein
MNRSSSKRLTLVLSTALLTTAYLAVPLASDQSFSFGPGKAFAAGNGNGGGNGHGGGNGNGHAGGNGNGNGNAGGNGNGNAGVNGNASGNTHPDNHGAVASSLGALNAAHASSTALANAAPNSRVGRIATYRNASATAAADEAAAAQADADNLAAQQNLADAQAAYNTALADALDDVNNPAVIAAQADLTAAQATATQAALDAAAAEEAAANAEAAKAAALDAAANKKPVSPETQAALDELLAGK